MGPVTNCAHVLSSFPSTITVCIVPSKVLQNSKDFCEWQFLTKLQMPQQNRPSSQFNRNKELKSNQRYHFFKSACLIRGTQMACPSALWKIGATRAVTKLVYQRIRNIWSKDIRCDSLSTICCPVIRFGFFYVDTHHSSLNSWVSAKRYV